MVAVSTIVRRNNASRAYEITPETVTKLRNIAVSTIIACDTGFYEKERASWNISHVLAFISGMIVNVTKEILCLKILDVEGVEHDARFSWHVMVSPNAFSFVVDNVWGLMPEDLAIRRIACVRPILALTGTETPNVLWGSLYHAKPSSSFMRSKVMQCELV